MTLENTILPEIITSVVYEKYTLELLTGNIVRIHIHENAFLDMEDLKEFKSHKTELTKNQPHALLFLAPQLGNLTKEGREYAASAEASVNAVAKAIVTFNLGMRILVDFFLIVNKPRLPHRSFSNEQEALQWLQEMLLTKKLSEQNDTN